MVYIVCMAKKPKIEHASVPVVPGKPHTVETLVATLAKYKKAARISDYRIIKTTGMDVSQSSVRRFFYGYTTPAEAARVPDPMVPGRTSLAIALRIVQAMGLDLEVVMRESASDDSKV